MFTKTTQLTQRFFIAAAVFFVSLFSSLQSHAATVHLQKNGALEIYYWSLIQSGGYAGINKINSTDDVIVDKKCTLIIDVTNAVCNEIDFGTTTTGADWATVEILDGMKLTVTNLVVSNIANPKTAVIKLGSGSGSPATGGGELVCAGFTGTNFDIQSNGGQITVTGSGDLPSSVSSYNDLIVDLPDTSDNLNLATGITVNGSLQLISGRLVLGNYNLNMAAASSIIGGSAASYVRANSVGKFTARAFANTPKTYPLGYNPYLPLTITLPSGATATDFTVGVRSGVENLTSTITDHVVNATWELTTNASVNDVNVTLGWNATENQTGFNTARTFMMARVGTGLWTAMDPSTAPLGTDVSGSSNGFNDYVLSNVTGQSFVAGTVLNPVVYTLVGDDKADFQMTVGLPVEFISFTAEKQGNEMAMLNFSTAWEINNAGFEVERSTNGISWTKIGFVAGHGNSNDVNNYAFPTSLANLNTAVVYYRLKQVDFNGQFEYSATRTIRLSAAAAKAVSVYPNPATSKISVSLEGVAAGEMAKIAVMDMSGKILISANQMVEEGNFSMDMNIDNLTKGNYIVNISSATVNYTTKLVKF